MVMRRIEETVNVMIFSPRAVMMAFLFPRPICFYHRFGFAKREAWDPDDLRPFIKQTGKYIVSCLRIMLSTYILLH